MPHCVAVKTNGQPCDKHAVNGDTLCRRHRTVENRRVVARRVQEIWFRVLDMLWTENPDTIRPLQVLIARAYLDDEIDDDTTADLLESLEDEWRWYREMRPAAPVAPKSDLHALTMDAQNVHTQAVAKQTSSTMETLLAIPVPEEQETLKEIAAAWGLRKGATKRVVKDMSGWYKKSECREENDWLYKRLLDCVWTRIQIHEHKTELTERLWEECFDAVKMCCEGHLSRLCSVLVGFDADAKQEVPVGEILQSKIAAIAERDIPVEYKVGEAWAVFEELKIPMEDREAWIDAF